MTPLNLLIIEDSEDDAALVVRALKQAGYATTFRRVDTADDLRDALDTGTWEIAIADYTMPGFSGTRALAMVREKDRDLPFIFVSGTMGEDIAVAALKTGAHDYMMKGDLSRLAPAVERELREALARREQSRANERVVYLAYHDSLTDLPNRSLFHDRLQQAVLASRREQSTASLLVVDLDGFKEINDTYGHDAGDRVLQQVATRLRATLRQSDTVARLGGDEFAVLLPATELDGAVLAAKKILNDLNHPIIVDGRPLVVSGSIGIGAYPTHAANGYELLHRADMAMYVAKRDHAGFAVYSANGESQTDQRLALTTALRRAIDTNQFVLDYQPIVALRTGAIVGLESLLRWEHPEQGRLLPKEFIHVAERSGLITPLTTFAIDRALREWPGGVLERPTITVNLSPRSMQDPGFPLRIKQMLAERGVHASTLSLEVTENLIMTDPDGSARCLKQLADMGIRLIVDDFGTGYSSLSYLRRLPVHDLKIDQSFVADLARGEDDALVRSIIDLAHNMRLGVIAEGVESASVCDRLLELGCDAAQGHFIHPPGAAKVVAQFVARHESIQGV